MSGTFEVLAALQAHAVSPTGANISGSRIAWPGKAFDPGTTAWYRASFTPTEQPVMAEVGLSARVRHRGVFQIDVYYPKGNYGDGALRQEAERIAAAYKAGTSLSSSGVYTRIESAAAGRTKEEEAWLSVAVQVWWRADVGN